MIPSWIPGFIVILTIAVMILANAIKVLREYERGVIFRLGRLLRERDRV